MHGGTTAEQPPASTGSVTENVRIGQAATQLTRGELLGYILYLVTFHQFINILTWATNAVSQFPMLSYIFPNSIDGNDQWMKHVYKYDLYPMVPPRPFRTFLDIVH